MEATPLHVRVLGSFRGDAGSGAFRPDLWGGCELYTLVSNTKKKISPLKYM